MDNGGSVPPGNGSQTKRSTIDQDVERAFDLLRHYQGFLRKPSDSLTDEQATRAIDQLEGVMRKWLPRAGAAQDRLLDDVCAAIGDREKAARLLANVQLTPALNECMAKVALLAVPTNQTAQRATATCRRELQHWRTLLPPVRRGPDQLRYVDPDDRFASRAVGMYWSADLTSRPSRLGASLFLAAACDAVAAAARKQGMPVESLRPALRLAQRLRDNPEWTHVDAREAVQVIDEQVALAREVQDLLAEIDLGSVKPSSTGKVLAKPEAIPKASTLAPTTNPTGRETLIRIHEAAKVLTGRLRTLIELIREYPMVGGGLLRLDLHLHLPDGEDPDPGEPERASRWRAAIAPLKADLGNAAIGWSEVTDGPDRSLQRLLTASGKGASCGPIECPSYHELVIVLGRGILDPTSFKDADREPLGANGSVARLRAVGALTVGNPWREIIDGLDREFDKALGLLPQEAGTGRSLAAEVRSERERENPAGIPAAHPLTPPTFTPESGSLQFNAAERAIVLLVRDGGHPRSTRDYAKDVGVSHTTLSRNEHWQRAWKAAQEGAKKDANDMPRGSKDGEGNLEAWREEACENCRQEPIVASVTVNDEVVRLCEGCAEKHRPRTS